jgi:O-antigen/teichoic acid export membrane protein
LGQAISVVAAFGSSVVLAHILTPHELGVFAIAFALSTFVQAMGPLGIAAYVIREHQLSEETLASAFTVNGITGLLFALVLFGLSWIPNLVLGEPTAGPVLRVLSLLPLLSVLSFRPMAILHREMRFKRIAIIAAASACFAAAVSIVLAIEGQSYMSPAYATVAAAGLSSVTYNLAAPRRFGTGISFGQWKTIAWFGFRITSVSGIMVVAGRANEVLVGRLLGLGALGLYSRATTLANPIWDNVYGTATRVLYARMAEDMRTTGELHVTFLRGLENITAVMWPFLIGLAVLSGPVVFHLFGPVWVPAAAPLSVLLVSQMIMMCFGMIWELFIINDEVSTQSRIEIVRSLIWVVACVIGCRFGLVGAALASVIAAIAGFLLYVPHVRRLSGIPRDALPTIYKRSGILTMAAAIPSTLLMIRFAWSPRTPMIFILVSVALGIAFWCAALRFLRHPLWSDARALLYPKQPASH